MNQTRTQNSGSKSALEITQENRPFKVGILGCGQIGTMVLTKFLEA